MSEIACALCNGSMSTPCKPPNAHDGPCRAAEYDDTLVFAAPDVTGLLRLLRDLRELGGHCTVNIESTVASVHIYPKSPRGLAIAEKHWPEWRTAAARAPSAPTVSIGGNAVRTFTIVYNDPMSGSLRVSQAQAQKILEDNLQAIDSESDD